MPIEIASLMARFPERGKVKTRLAGEVGDDVALRVYRALLNNVMSGAAPIAADRYRLGCFLTPSERIMEFNQLFPDLTFCETQIDADLGGRMKAALEVMFEKYHADKALLIGVDIPDIDRRILRRAFSALDSTELVIGPTTDGGYYLIGMKRLIPALFEGIDWGTDRVLQQSLAIARAGGVECELLERLNDLDTAEDLKLFPAFAE